VVDNYTEPRMMAIIGEEGEMVAKSLAGQHFHVPSSKGMTPLKYVIRVEAGSGGPTSRAARMAEADKLYGLGAVDDQYVLQKHRVRKPTAILQRLYQKRQQGLVGGGAKRPASKS
jgi:predicted aconitase with swiveling domain